MVCLCVQPAFANDDWTSEYISRSVPDSISVALHNHSTQKLVFLNGIWDARRPGDKEGHPVEVPGVYDFEGELVFQRFFEIDSSFVDYRLKLVALGINSRCKIFLNNQFLSSHFGGHTAFEVELPRDKILIPGRNTIKILVDNRRNARSSLPLKHSPGLLKNYGGIFRDVYIVGLPAVSIEALSTKMSFSDNFKLCQLSVTAKLKEENIVFVAGEEKSVEFRVEVRDSTGRIVLARTPREKIQFDRQSLQKTVSLEVKGFNLWSPGKPALYKLRILVSNNKTIIDQHEQLFGFSHVVVDSGLFVLNGKPLSLQGVAWYENYLTGGPAASRAEMGLEVARIVQMGANAVRVVGAPPHPAFLDICDKMGLLVFVEGPLSFVPEMRLADRVFHENVLNYFQEMVEGLAMHPSVAAWGLGTDLQAGAFPVKAHVAEIRQAVKQWSSRPLYAVVHNYTIVRDIPAVDVLIRVFNNFETQRVYEWLDAVRSGPKFQGTVVTLGYPVVRSLHTIEGSGGGENSPETERRIDEQELQAYKLNRALAALARGRQPAGVLVENFSDWRANQPLLRFGPRPDMYLVESGVYSSSGEKRIASEVVALAFRDGQNRKMTAKLSKKDSPTVYPIVGLGVILLSLFNFNRNRRLRVNLKRVFLHSHGFYAEIKENRKTSNMHTLFLGIATVLAPAIILSSITYNFRKQPLFDNLIDLVVTSPAIKAKFIWLVWSPGASLAIFAVSIYALFAFLILILKFASMMLNKRLPIIQFYTLVFWVSASFIWLLPIVPIYFRIINQTNWSVPALGFFVLVSAWTGVRMFRAIKVVFVLSFFRMVLLAVIIGTVVFGGLGAYYDGRSALFEYLPMYWEVVQDQFGWLSERTSVL